jgi:hypothetical protein
MLNRHVVAIVTAASMGAALALGVGLVVGAPDTAVPWSAFGSGGSSTSSSVSYSLGSTTGQAVIGTGTSAGFRLGTGIWYGVCAVESVGDSDCDATSDATETACGSNPGNPASIPERLDGAFAGVDDDGNEGTDEPLPGSAAYDCDGDGYTGAAEAHVYSYLPQTTGDQKVCQEYDFSHPNPNTDIKPSRRWPADLSKAPTPDSFNRINILDLTSLLAPVRYFDTNVGTNPGDVRWDLSPGPGLYLTDINIEDLTALLAGAKGFPPMLASARAFDGAACPYAP